MILYDSACVWSCADFGIMLPIPADRAGRIAQSLGPSVASGAFPGPVLDIKTALAFLGRDGGAAGVITQRDAERVHKKEYAAALFSGGAGLERELLNAYELIGADGKPFRYEPQRAVKPLTALFDGLLLHCTATYLACSLALADKAVTKGASGRGFCYFLGGGNHHARYDTGAGFCLMNDIIIAARKLQAEGAARNIWIIDVDAHKGCGSAELVRFMREGRPEPFEEGCRLLTLSIHMADGWPLDEETLRGADPLRAPLLPSDIEIPVAENEEASYCRKLGKGLTDLEALAKRAGAGKPDLAIVVDGADPYEHDGLASSAKLRLSLAACLERDLLVLGFLEARGIPSAWIMAGGYGDRAWEPSYRFLRALKR